MAIIPNAVIWRHCSDAEAGVIDNSLRYASVKLRRIWAEGGGLDDAAPEYADFLKLVAFGGIGIDRAAQLLAPSE